MSGGGARRRWSHSAVVDDRGSATVWAVAAIAVLLVLALAGVQLGAAAVARHRAESAADLAALAAAGSALAGSATACEQAGRVTGHARVELVSCAVAGADALVEVTARAGRPWDRFGAASARARAGPAGP